MSHLAVTQDVHVALGEVIAHKLGDAFLELNPVGSLDSSSIAGTLFLLLHLDVEFLLVDGHAVLTQDKLSQVKGEAEGVIEGKGLLAIDNGLAGSLSVGHNLLDEFHARFQSAKESILFFLSDVLDKVGLSLDFGVSLTHAINEGVNKAIHERLAETQESVTITHSTAQDATYDVACLGVAGQLAVSHRECNGAHVVGNNTHGDIHVLVVTILLTAHFSQLADEWLEYVGVIVGFLALERHAQAFQTHTGVNDLVGQRLQGAVHLAVILHEHEVPDFHYQRIILIDERSAGNCCLSLFGA